MNKLVALVFLLGPSLAAASGTLHGPDGDLRVVYTHSGVRIDGDVARTTVTQVFVNDLPHDVEVTYGFPLPAGASVTGFASFIDGRRLDARADDKAAAERTFEAAAGDGRHAALAEADEDRFRLRLTVVPAGGSRRVELAYTQTLGALGGERTFVLPAGHSAAGVYDVEVAVTGDRPLLGVASENHPDARVERAATGFVARLSRIGGLERDLALRWQSETSPTDLAARAVRAVAGEPAYLEARFALNADPWPGARPPSDVILVVDTSISMAGEPLTRALGLARDIVKQAAPGDRIAVVRFASSVEITGWQPAANVRLDGITAGGTSNLEAALDAAADLLPGARNPTLVLLTDGQPTVGALEPAAAATDFAGTRALVACFNYPSRVAYLEKLVPHATTRYVPDGPAGESAAREIARLANAPVVEGLTLTVEGPGSGGAAGVVPARLAVGENARVLLRIDGDAIVRVAGTLHGAPVVLTAHVSVPDAPDEGGDRGLPVEWARLRVRDLERTAGAGGAGALVAAEEIRVLGKRYGLVTRYTSYVAADATVSPDDVKPGDPELRVRAPRSAQGVRALLPWGETVECAWQEDEGLWLGRFLVPRGVPDGLYRLRLFVDEQGGTRAFGTLPLKVDSKPPELELSLEDGRLIARPRTTDLLLEDRSDVRRVVVLIDGAELTLVRRGSEQVWEAPVALTPGRHPARLVASDAAGNSSEVLSIVTVAL